MVVTASISLVTLMIAPGTVALTFDERSVASRNSSAEESVRKRVPGARCSVESD